MLTDGELVWNEAIDDFDYHRSTALPAPLRGWFATEPMWVDLRWARDEDQLSVRHSRFRDAVATLAAPMHGRSKDDLEGEDVRQHRRATRLRRAAVTTVSVLLVAAVLLGLVAVQQRETAQQQTRVALSRALAAESAAQDILSPQLAVRLGVAAYAASPTLQARANLVRLMDRNRHVSAFLQPPPSRVPGSDPRVGAVALSEDGALLALVYRSTGEVVVWDTALRREVNRLGPAPELAGEQSVVVRFSRDHRTLVISMAGSVFRWVLQQGPASKTELPAQFRVDGVAPDGRLVAVSDETFPPSSYSIRDLTSGEVLVDEPTAQHGRPVEFTADGRYIVYMKELPESQRGQFGIMSEFRLFDLQRRSWLDGASVVIPALSRWAVSHDPVQLYSLSPHGVLEVWDLRSGQRKAQREIPGAAVREVAVSAAGAVVLVSATGGAVVGLDGTLSHSAVVAQHPLGVRDIAVSADGSTVYSVSDGGAVVQSAPLADRRVSALPITDPGTQVPAHSAESKLGRVVDFVASPDGAQLLVQRVEATELWDLRTRQRRLTVPFVKTDGFDASVDVSGGFSPDGGRLGVRDGRRIHVWDSGSLDEVATVNSPEDQVAAEQLLVKLLGGGSRLIRQASGPYGEKVAYYAVWPTGQQLLAEGRYDSTSATARGSYAVTTTVPRDAAGKATGHTGITVWKMAENGPPERVGHAESQVAGVTGAVSADGRFAVAADANGGGQIIDLGDSATPIDLAIGDARREMGEFLFADDADLLVEQVSPYDYGESSDGLFHKRLLFRDRGTGSLLGEWEDPFGEPDQHSGFLTMELAGGDTLLTNREDGTIGMWKLGTDDWLRELCALGGEMTGDERQRYLLGLQVTPVCGA
ncbi:MAG TPA: WD40 repeat domain-containing protein [Pseudonocardiaceae bacterium]|nr:WD40 repeat domain-containing protein [Pseudonocardiaceae bacterium]